MSKKMKPKLDFRDKNLKTNIDRAFRGIPAIVEYSFKIIYPTLGVPTGWGVKDRRDGGWTWYYYPKVEWEFTVDRGDGVKVKSGKLRFSLRNWYGKMPSMETFVAIIRRDIRKVAWKDAGTYREYMYYEKKHETEG